jgi:CBS domain-containing protein
MAEMGDVIGLENTQGCGMGTDRDIVVRTVAAAQDPATTTLADLCSHACVTVPLRDSVEEAVQLMRTHAMRRVPVVDGGSRWAWGRSGSWQWSGSRTRHLARGAVPPSA